MLFPSHPFQFRSLLRRVPLRRGALVLLIGVYANVGWFPFERLNGVVAQEPNTTAVASPPSSDKPSTTPEVDPRIVAELRRLAGGTPAQLALALRESIRQRMWQELDLYVGGGRVSGLAAEEQLQAAEFIGTLFLSRAIEAPEVKPETRAILESLLASLATSISDEDELDKAITSLGSGKRDAELAAARTLLRGGTIAISKLAKAAAAPNPATSRSKLIEVLRSFQQPGVDAVKQFALYGKDELRSGAQQTLWSLNQNGAIPVLLLSLQASSATQDERTLATSLLQKVGAEKSTLAEIEQFLARNLSNADSDYFASIHDTSTHVLWQLNEARDEVSPELTSGIVRSARQVADAGEMLRRLGAMQPNTLRQAYGADLRYRYLVDPNLGGPGLITTLSNQWGDMATDPALLADILAQSKTQSLRSSHQVSDPLRAVAVIRVMAASGDESLVQSSGGKPSALVQSTSDPNSLVRFEAASAISQLAPQHPYLGSGRVLDRWIEMSQLESAPKAILLINQPEVSMPASQWLSEKGFSVLKVRSVAELLREVDKGGDLQLVVSTTRPPDYSGIEMIDRLRGRPLGGSLPIVLVGPTFSGFEQLGQRWSALTLHFDPYSSDPELGASESAIEAGLNANWERILAGSSAPILGAAERSLYELEGVLSLSQLAEQEGSDAIYGWRQKEPALIEASRRSGFSDPSFKVLSSLGSHSSQDLLASLATTSAVDLATRQKAAEAFAVSVQRFGTRLSRRQVLDLYERYNVSSEDSAREVMGKVLDAMEARAGVTSKN